MGGGLSLGDSGSAVQASPQIYEVRLTVYTAPRRGDYWERVKRIVNAEDIDFYGQLPNYGPAK